MMGSASEEGLEEGVTFYLDVQLIGHGSMMALSTRPDVVGDRRSEMISWELDASV
jgi:hypothetical protein